MAQRIPKQRRLRSDGSPSVARNKVVGRAPQRAQHSGTASEAPAGAARALPAARCAVGDFFRSAREAQRLSQDQVADMTAGQSWRVSRATVSGIERGRHMPSLEALLALSRILHVKPLEALERAELASATPVDLTGQTVKTLSLQARDAFNTGDYRKAAALYDATRDLLRLKPSDDPAEHERVAAQIEIGSAAALRQFGAMASAENAAKSAVLKSDRYPDLLAQAYSVFATIQWQTGFASLAVDTSRRAVEIAKECDERVQGRALLGLGNALLERQRFQEAHQAYLDARAKTLSCDDVANLIHSERGLGLSLAAMGDRARARTWLARSLERARKQSLPLLEAHSLVELGRVTLEGGKIDEAENFALEALLIARPRDHALSIFRGVWLQFLVAERRTPGGDHAQLVESLNRLYTRLPQHAGESYVREFEASPWFRDGSRERRRS